jgi:hypothetical protein
MTDGDDFHAVTSLRGARCRHVGIVPNCQQQLAGLDYW